MDVREKLVDIVKKAAYSSLPSNTEDFHLNMFVTNLLSHGVTVQEHGNWKYYHKQNKAVCTSCSFERDLDANFGKAIACPNCGAKMIEVSGGE